MTFQDCKMPNSRVFQHSTNAYTFFATMQAISNNFSEAFQDQGLFSRTFHKISLINLQFQFARLYFSAVAYLSKHAKCNLKEQFAH